MGNANADKVIKVVKSLIFPQNFYIGNFIHIIEKILYKLIREFLIFYIYHLDFLWNKILDPYCFTFVLLVCQMLLIIMNVYNTQLFNLCAAEKLHNLLTNEPRYQYHSPIRLA